MFMTDFSCYVSKQSVINIKTPQGGFYKGSRWDISVFIRADTRGGMAEQSEEDLQCNQGEQVYRSVCQTQGPPPLNSPSPCLNAAYSIQRHFLQFSNSCQLTQCLPNVALGHSTFGGHHPAPWTLFQRHLSLGLPQIRQFQFTLIYSALQPKL